MKYVNGGNLSSYVNNKKKQQQQQRSNRISSSPDIFLYGTPNSKNNETNRSTILPERTVQNVAVQVLCGLQSMHESYDSCHGDIHPSNILLQMNTEFRSDSGKDSDNNEDFGKNIQVMVTDFGSAKKLNDCLPSPTSTTPKMKNMSTKAFAATAILPASSIESVLLLQRDIGFIAPELVVSSLHADIKQKNHRVPTATIIDKENLFDSKMASADMWSLGSLVYYMFAGYSPFEEENDLSPSKNTNNNNKILSNIRNEKAITYPSCFPRKVKQFLSNCFQKDPTMRMTATEALQHPWLAEAYQEYNVIMIKSNHQSSPPLIDIDSPLQMQPSTNESTKEERENQAPKFLKSPSVTKTVKVIVDMNVSDAVSFDAYPEQKKLKDKTSNDDDKSTYFMVMKKIMLHVVGYSKNISRAANRMMEANASAVMMLDDNMTAVTTQSTDSTESSNSNDNTGAVNSALIVVTKDTTARRGRKGILHYWSRHRRTI